MKIIKIFTILLFIFGLGYMSPISAQVNPTGSGIQGGDFNICSFVGPLCGAINPGGGGDSITGESSLDFVTSRINQVITIIFIGIIVLAVYIIIKAGLKYIQSQGAEDQIADAQKAIRSVFLGIGLLFVGIVGIILVLSFFGGTSLIGTNLTPNEIFRLN